MDDEGDEIVMTPLQGSVRGKVIRIARVPKIYLKDKDVQHFAGGPYKGIVINKATNEKPDPGPPETERSFTAVIGDATSKSREWRELRFWFQPDTRAIPQVRDAITDTFFKELMDPHTFPKEYIMFIRRLLVLVKQYSAILRIELEFRPLNPDEAGPTTIRKRKQIVRTSVLGGPGMANGSGGQVPSQEDIKVLLYSEAVTQDQLEETLFAAGFLRAPPVGGSMMHRPGYIIQEDLQVIIRQEIQAGNDLETALYNAGYVPNPGAGEPFSAEGRSQEDIQKLLYRETVPVDELNIALAEAGFVRAPSAVYMKQPGARAQEDLRNVLMQETASGQTLEEALFIAGFVPSSRAGPSKTFTAPGRSQDDIRNMLVNKTINIDELNVAVEEAGFVKAPGVGVVLRYPGARGQEDLKQVLKQEVTAGMELEQALYTAGFVPNPKNEKQVFAAPRRSQEDIQQMLVKETMTFDQLNCALSEAGFVMAPGIGASLKYPGLDSERDAKLIVGKEVDKGVTVEDALWTAGYIPDPEMSEPVFSKPGRSEEEIKQMLYRTEVNITLFNNALHEAGFVRSNISSGAVTVQPGARCMDDLRVVLREETAKKATMQEALFISGYVPKPDIGDRVFTAEGYTEDDIRALLKKPDLTLEELEVAIYEAGFYRPPGLSVANRPHMQEDVRYLINRELEEGATLEEALYKSGYVKAPSKGVSVRRAPTISRKGWEVLWESKKTRLLQVLEDAYPNVMSTENLIRVTELKRNNIDRLLAELKTAGSIQELSPGNWMCVHVVQAPVPKPKEEHKARTESMIERGEESPPDSESEKESAEMQAKRKHEIKMVTHIPHLPKNEQPTIAIVTLLFCEKLAVDAMMHSRTTYIRYKVEGEGQVYTVGKIGKHRIVATKLARIGMKTDAMIAAGNTITRLLGTFGEIEHVILLGVGGGARIDPESTLRLGDIVVTRPKTEAGPLYIHCAESEVSEDGRATFMTQDWKPKENTLQKLIDNLERDSAALDTMKDYREEALRELSGGQTSFTRPGAETDKFYAPGEEDRDTQIHYGLVGSGKGLGKDDDLRRKFAVENDCMVIDSGFQAVMQSIDGNRKDTFAVIRGISDYRDGTQRREWQPYAALAAAAYMKTLVLQLPAEADSDSE